MRKSNRLQVIEHDIVLTFLAVSDQSDVLSDSVPNLVKSQET